MAGHGLLADEQRCGGLLVGGPGGDLGEHFGLPVGKPTRQVHRTARLDQASYSAIAPRAPHRSRWPHRVPGWRHRHPRAAGGPHRSGSARWRHRRVPPSRNRHARRPAGPEGLLPACPAPAERPPGHDRPKRGTRRSHRWSAILAELLAGHRMRTRGHHRPGRSRRRRPADVPAGTGRARDRRGLSAPLRPRRQACPARAGVAQRRAGDRARAPGRAGRPARHRQDHLAACAVRPADNEPLRRQRRLRSASSSQAIDASA